ncbi:hypothetical protein CFSAN001627_06750 [Clostridium botulinum CFSAN001627]|uniref:Uncharacterized protein n=1 Tax=Clostridium botulinum CFSAN001627 TaxID=1232189 RepID=M1ZYJ0_CLOBO|nr:hypothetical protein CFSAN001627_06750 [Clostridium botulinum CFSAN001627]EPS49696.1 hypothetical protein CFSAN002369_10335 [Clostridium botulinum CFSAN002369]
MSLSINPSFSASSIMEKAILSFTLFAGLKYSTLAIILAFNLFSFFNFSNSNNGVFPINSVIFLYIFS